MPAAIITGFKFVGGVLGGLLIKWAAKIATEETFQWALLKIGQEYVDSTATKKDNEWFAKFKEIVED